MPTSGSSIDCVLAMCRRVRSTPRSSGSSCAGWPMPNESSVPLTTPRRAGRRRRERQDRLARQLGRQEAVEHDQVEQLLAGGGRRTRRPWRRTAPRWAAARTRSGGRRCPVRRAARGAADPAARPPTPRRRAAGSRAGPSSSAVRRRPASARLDDAACRAAARRSRRRPGSAVRAARSRAVTGVPSARICSRRDDLAMPSSSRR